jgi:hypothetical protein
MENFLILEKDERERLDEALRVERSRVVTHGWFEVLGPQTLRVDKKLLVRETPVKIGKNVDGIYKYQYRSSESNSR